MHLNVFVAVNSFAGNPAKLQLILYLGVPVGLQPAAAQLVRKGTRLMQSQLVQIPSVCIATG